MPLIRLFAAAREAAGTATDEVPGLTVDDVLAEARARYGAEFAAVLAASRVWCNGEPTGGEVAVGPDDEIAVLPPVSGGSGPTADPGSSAHRRSRPVDPAARPERRRPAPPSPVRARRPPATPTPTPSVTPSRPDPTGLTDVRTIPVPIPGSGEVVVRGKRRPVVAPRQSRTAFGRRFGTVYDTGPWKVTLGLVWFAAVLLGLVAGWVPLTALLGVAAGWAALDVARRRQEVGEGPDAWVAALGAGALGASGAAGSFAVGVALLALAVAAVVAAALGGPREHGVARAGATVMAAAPFGLAAASVLLTRDLEIGAVVTLLLIVSAYDLGDFIVGSGASNAIEGPATGIVTIAVMAMVIAVLQVPPFRGAPMFTFAAFAAVLCPLGQIAVSALLPTADAAAPAARRLDSLVVLAPVWALTVGLYIDSLG